MTLKARRPGREDGPLPDAERPTSWRWIGRLLPRSLRDLMYEPMCDDLWRAHVTASVPGGRLLLWTRFFGCFAACVGYSLPRYFVERGGRLPLSERRHTCSLRVSRS